jgi:L-ascorbate metabolism protein UlaG (beta-lactamase superfamily)
MAPPSGYVNLDGTTPDKGLADLLRWQIGDRLTGKRRRDPGGFVTPRRENDGSALAKASAHLTWIGHATFAMRLGGLMVLTDPIWAERVGTTKRHTAPGVALDPIRAHGVDVVTVSHAHYDHLDLWTLKRIGPEPLYVVPKDCGDLLTGAGLPNVVELDWFDSHEVKTAKGRLKITLVPSQHWSMRVPWDRNKRLWGGFVYEADDGTAYHAGDTAFSELVFRKIGEAFPSIDWAMLPIGAYDPVWFMSPQHMGPEEATRAFELLGAKTLCAMHWGTFKLTDEPLGEPPARARQAFAAEKLGLDRLHVYDIGEMRDLVRI